MAVLRVVATGRIDHHYGYAGAMLKVMPSSVLVAVLTTLACFAVCGAVTPFFTSRQSA